MLHLLSRAATAAHLADALAGGRPERRQQIAALDYGRAIALGDEELGPGAWVFLGLDRLDDDSAFAVMEFRARLGRRPGIACHNHPTRTLHRFELFRLLHDAGVNAGDTLRLEDRRRPLRWPVFLHDELVPQVGPPELLPDAGALLAAIRRLDAAALYRPAILIREAPGLQADRPRLGHVRTVGGRVFADAAARTLLARPGAPDARRLAVLFAEAGIAVGSMVLAPTEQGAMVLDAGTDPVLLAAADGLPAVAEALLALA
ncbi:hypothetical protein [Stella sp.]|uniref:hypothetical protein n=1 Tax=Stella sp. TaxID=2912054 RepID=UPI0035AEB866